MFTEITEVDDLWWLLPLSANLFSGVVTVMTFEGIFSCVICATLSALTLFWLEWPTVSGQSVYWGSRDRWFVMVTTSLSANLLSGVGTLVISLAVFFCAKSILCVWQCTCQNFFCPILLNVFQTTIPSQVRVYVNLILSLCFFIFVAVFVCFQTTFSQKFCTIPANEGLLYCFFLF